jgi:hypothetical protein
VLLALKVNSIKLRPLTLISHRCRRVKVDISNISAGYQTGYRAVISYQLPLSPLLRRHQLKDKEDSWLSAERQLRVISVMPHR